jgi:hypothetical protein
MSRYLTRRRLSLNRRLRHTNREFQMADEYLEGIMAKAATTKAKARIAEIDAMFEGATGWGSWMVEAANEREALADKFGLPHKYQARTSAGERTD